MKKSSIALMLSLSLFQTLGAADFTIKDGETVNIQQVLSDEGDKGKIEEGGTLSTGSTIAVLMQNDDQKLKNHGEISTSGNDAYGILSNGADAKIKNSGEISTSGDRASGIFSIASNARVKNSRDLNKWVWCQWNY